MKEYFNIIKKFSIARIINVINLYTSFMISRLLKLEKHWGVPYAISIEPTTSCNLSCPECPSGLKSFSRKAGNLKIDLNKQIVDSFSNKLMYINYYFQGEPYINKNFLEFIKYAKSKNIYCSTSTNAHFLNDETSRKTVQSGLNRLIISIDGTSQETYQDYRINGELSKVIEGTKNIMKWKKELNSNTPNVIFQFLVTRQNEHQIDEIKKLGSKLGVNEIKLKTIQVYDYKNGNKLIPINEKHSRYKLNKNGTYSIKNKFYNNCWRMWSSCVITVDGTIVPCCFDKDAKYTMGNIKANDFNKIWKGSDYKKFRQNILSDRKNIDICRNCSEGSKVWT